MTRRKYTPYVIERNFLVAGEAAALRAVFNEFIHDRKPYRDDTGAVASVNLAAIEPKWVDAEIRRQMWYLVRECNDKYWNVNLFVNRLADGGTLRSLIYTKGCYHGEHTDYEPMVNDHCKVSMSVALSDDYKGGDFVICGKRIERLKRGDAVVFPSYTSHAILPVTSGVRHSLAAFYEGAPYR